MKNWVSSRKLIHTPTAIGTRWTSSSITSAGSRKAYGVSARRTARPRRRGVSTGAPGLAGATGVMGAVVVVTELLA